MRILGATQLTAESSIAFDTEAIDDDGERIDFLAKQRRHVEARRLRMRGEFAQLPRRPN
jgi:hypothetical protein